MSRRHAHKVAVILDTGGIGYLPVEDLEWVIRGADEMIFRGGRTLLTKLLKGSREARIKELGLDRGAAYGKFRELPAEQVAAKIDWAIKHDYLRIEYDRRLPLLVHSPLGWEICKRVRVQEFLADFDRMLASGAQLFNLAYLIDRNREMILQLLDAVAATGDPKYIPLLRAWAEIDYKKVRAAIHRVIAELEGQRPAPAPGEGSAIG